MRRQLQAEEVMTIEVLARRGVAKRAIARQLGVSEGAVRYQLAKAAEEPSDGRAGKPLLADEYEAVIRSWVEAQDATRPANCRALHEYLVEEHEYPHGYRTVLRWVRRHYGRPKTRTWRRVETPPGAQVQTDWGEFPRVLLGGEERPLHAFVMVLSHSRRVAVVWSLREDQLSWLHCHNEAFRRLGGVAAVNRIDNLKTGISQGAGAWGTVNPTYRSYAATVGFHVDACAPRRGDHKGKVEAKVRLTRLRSGPKRRPYGCLEELQEETDASLDRWSRTAKCPVTGGTVYDTWRKEQELLRPLGRLPEPFDVVVMRRVHRDCLVHFEGGQYTVPFRFVERQVEVRGCAGKVQIVGDGEVLCEYPRGERRLHIDARCYEGPATDRVLPPTPLGRMGRRLQEIVEQPVYQRPLDLYAALAEVAR